MPWSGTTMAGKQEWALCTESKCCCCCEEENEALGAMRRGENWGKKKTLTLTLTLMFVYEVMNLLEAVVSERGSWQQLGRDEESCGETMVPSRVPSTELCGNNNTNSINIGGGGPEEGSRSISHTYSRTSPPKGVIGLLPILCCKDDGVWRSERIEYPFFQSQFAKIVT